MTLDTIPQAAILQGQTAQIHLICLMKDKSIFIIIITIFCSKNRQMAITQSAD